MSDYTLTTMKLAFTVSPRQNRKEAGRIARYIRRTEGRESAKDFISYANSFVGRPKS